MNKKLVVGLAIIVFSVLCSEFLARDIAAIIYPPTIPEAKASLRVVSVKPVANENIETAIAYIEWLLYGVGAFAGLFLVYVLAKGNKPSDGSTSESNKNLSEESLITGRIGQDSSMTAAIPVYNKIDHSSLTGRTQAINIEKTEGTKQRKQKPKFTIEKAKADLAKSEIQTNNSSTQAISSTATHKPDTGAQTIGNGRYKIEKPLASGGAGVVYRAWDTKLNRRVAAKQLFNELAKQGSHLKRFEEEAQALAAMSHPNIVPIFDYVTDNGHWFVMEFLEGGDVVNRLENNKPFSIQEAINVCIDVASGLEAAHEQGFVHRDIKPHNIIFAKNGTAKITDFGIAKTETSSVKTTVGLVLGSPLYLSPEQAAGEDLDARSDIYSLGITFYQMLTGKAPFDGETREILRKHIVEAPMPPSHTKKDVPENVDQIVLTMLSKSRDDRFQSASELKEALVKLKQELL